MDKKIFFSSFFSVTINRHDMLPITKENMSQILERDDISVISAVKDKVFYALGSNVISVKFNHYDNKLLVKLLPVNTHNAVQMQGKPYLILKPKGRDYFKIIKVSFINNHLSLDPVKYNHFNAGDYGFEVIYLDDADKALLNIEKLPEPNLSKPANINAVSSSQFDEQYVSNEELLTRIKQLETINADLSLFVLTTSHDLISPLSQVESLVNLLENEDLPSEAENLFQMIKSSVVKLKENIKELAEPGRYEKQSQSTDVNALIEEVVMSLKDNILSSKTSIISLIKEENCQVSKKNLRSLLYNLMSNAIKFRSPDRPSEIRITTSVKDGFFVLEVMDQGIGMMEEHLTTVFSLYHRLGQQVEGQGIGLYIVKKVVENAGGIIEVKSEYGKGTKFTLSFRQ